MIYNVYSIRDLKAENFGVPTISSNDDVAVRNFAHAIKSSGTILSTYKQDFQLMKIGTFDDVTGSIIPCDHIVVIDGNSIEV